MIKTLNILLKILGGKNDANIDFTDLVNLLTSFEFKQRIKGSHHIFYKQGITEIINIQPNENNKSKAYQVKQIRNIILKYKLGDFGND